MSRQFDTPGPVIFDEKVDDDNQVKRIAVELVQDPRPVYIGVQGVDTDNRFKIRVLTTSIPSAGSTVSCAGNSTAGSLVRPGEGVQCTIYPRDADGAIIAQASRFRVRADLKTPRPRRDDGGVTVTEPSAIDGGAAMVFGFTAPTEPVTVAVTVTFLNAEGDLVPLTQGPFEVTVALPPTRLSTFNCTGAESTGEVIRGQSLTCLIQPLDLEGRPTLAFPSDFEVVSPGGNVVKPISLAGETLTLTVQAPSSITSLFEVGLRLAAGSAALLQPPFVYTVVSFPSTRSAVCSSKIVFVCFVVYGWGY